MWTQWTLWVGIIFGVIPFFAQLLQGRYAGAVVAFLIACVFLSATRRRPTRRELKALGEQRERERLAALRHVERLKAEADALNRKVQ